MPRVADRKHPDVSRRTVVVASLWSTASALALRALHPSATQEAEASAHQDPETPRAPGSAVRSYPSLLGVL